jgi:hypothetical protein
MLCQKETQTVNFSPANKIKTEMSNIRITKNLVSKPVMRCSMMANVKNVHGHSYKLSVTVIGSPIENRDNVKFGMVIDFTDLKKIVKKRLWISLIMLPF